MMKSTLTIFLVFTSLAQSSYVPKMIVNYGLSEEQVSVLDEIITNQEEARRGYSDGFKTVLDTIFDLINGPDDDCSKVTTALARVKHGRGSFLNAISLALGESCSFGNSAYDYLDDAFAEITTALKLAQSGSYTDTRAEIEVHETAVRECFVNLVESEYDSIRTSLNTTDADTLAVIESARNGSRGSVILLINAVFNAIKVYAAAVPAGFGDVTLTFDIKEFQGKALDRIKAIVEYDFSLLKTLYIDSQLNGCGIVSGLAVNQYTLTRSYYSYMEANEGLYNTVEYFLKRVALGLHDDGVDVVSRTDVELRRVILNFDDGDALNVNSTLAIYPDSSSAAATTREGLHDLNVEVDFALFDLIYTAAAVGPDNYSETIDEIEAYRQAAAVNPTFDYPEYFFALIRGNETDDGIIKELQVLKDQVFYAAGNGTNKYFDADIVLANATYAGEASEDDFCAIRKMLDETLVAVRNFTQFLSAATFVMLKANNANCA